MPINESMEAGENRDVKNCDENSGKSYIVPRRWGAGGRAGGPFFGLTEPKWKHSGLRRGRTRYKQMLVNCFYRAICGRTCLLSPTKLWGTVKVVNERHLKNSFWNLSKRFFTVCLPVTVRYNAQVVGKDRVTELNGFFKGALKLFLRGISKKIECFGYKTK